MHPYHRHRPELRPLSRPAPALSPLPRRFFDRPVLKVAPELLGAILVRDMPGGTRLTGRIVEVEAYDGERDLACHASKGRTPRTDTLYADPGLAYVYLCYGMHHMLNAVCDENGYPAAALIRAVEPLDGVEAMDPGKAAAPLRIHRIASGPGRLARAFRITRALNRADLCAEGPLWIAAGEPVGPRAMARGTRIGVGYASVWARKPWRWAIRGHPAVSVPFARPKSDSPHSAGRAKLR